MGFELGCRFTIEYFGTGCMGGLVAVLILPGSYITLPAIRKVGNELRVYWGVFARIFVAGVAGCVVDCSTRNAFFGGFFAWHAFRWIESQGWKDLQSRLEMLLNVDRKK